jgi:hypothetical protein
MERRPDKYIDFESDTHTLGYDVIGMNHGGLTGHEIVDMSDGKRVHFIEDI